LLKSIQGSVDPLLVWLSGPGGTKFFDDTSQPNVRSARLISVVAIKLA
jgi:hypothetical protein